jgi:uncharacterized protein YbjT (DUF2867 family)/uncharacterized protein YndB with AHSA1/START domain
MNRDSETKNPKILLTGASGYVGGHLRISLESNDYPIRCVARNPEYLRSRVRNTTEVVRGDALDQASLIAALKGIDVAFYLIHSLGEKTEWREKEYQAARNFVNAAEENDVKRIIYLGGLGSGDNLSDHLASRQEVGNILRSSNVQVIEFRASIIIGAGSLSFEMIRALVNRIPLMIVPSWVRVKAQPIYIDDVVSFLMAAIHVDEKEHDIFEIGGADRVSYGDIMMEYSRQMGKRRIMIPVPVLSPYLSSLWLGLVTPVYAPVGKKLILGVSNETIIRDDRANRRFNIDPRGIHESVAGALSDERSGTIPARWNDPPSAVIRSRESKHSDRTDMPRFSDSYEKYINAPPDKVFARLIGIGGVSGYFHANWLWRLRGAIDVLLGGVGMKRGRRESDSLLPGDVVDFLRVEKIDPPHLLRFAVEMKLPGRAWLEFRITAKGTGSLIRQQAIMEVNGFYGKAYWYLVYPFHRYVFSGMLNALSRRLEGT